MLPVVYVWQHPWQTQLTPTKPSQFIKRRHRVQCPFSLLITRYHSGFSVNWLLFGFGFAFGFSWIYSSWILILHRPLLPRPHHRDCFAVCDVAAHRSCKRCSRRMSSYKYDKHTLCLHCRDVLCSVDVRCSECSNWSTELMQDHLKHRKSLVSRGKKKSAVTTPSSSSPSVAPSASPSVSSVASRLSLPSVSDDDKIKYVHSILASFLSQQVSQGSLGNNPFVSAPTEVSNQSPPLRGATG